MIIRAIVLLHTQQMAKISRTLQTYVNTKQLFTTITFYKHSFLTQNTIVQQLIQMDSIHGRMEVTNRRSNSKLAFVFHLLLKERTSQKKFKGLGVTPKPSHWQSQNSTPRLDQDYWCYWSSWAPRPIRSCGPYKGDSAKTSTPATDLYKVYGTCAYTWAKP